MTEQDYAEIDRRVAPLRDTLAQHLTLQQEICRQLMRRPVPFGVVTTSNGQHLINENKRGIIRCITNPGAANLNVKLYDGADGGNGTPKFKATLTAGESRPVFIVFHSGLLSMGDPGASVDGELFS